MVRTSSRRAASRRTSSRVAKVVEETRKEKTSGRPTRSSRRGRRASPEPTPAVTTTTTNRKKKASDDEKATVDESEEEEDDDDEDALGNGDVDFSIEYSPKLLKVGAEVFIRNTPNVSIRDKDLVGKKGIIKKVDSSHGKASMWYVVEIYNETAAKTRSSKKANNDNNNNREEFFLANSLVPASMDGSPRNFMPDSEVKAMSGRGRRKKKKNPAEEEGNIALDNVPKKNWIGKQIVFAAGRYEGENAWILGHGSGLVHLIMGDDEPNAAPIIVSRMSKQLVVVPEENEEIEPFEPEEYVGKEGIVNDGYGLDDRAYVANHGNGYLLVQLKGERPYTVLKVKNQFTIDSGNDSIDGAKSAGSKKNKNGNDDDGAEPKSKRRKTSNDEESNEEIAMDVDNKSANNNNSNNNDNGGKKLSLTIRKPKDKKKYKKKDNVHRVKQGSATGSESPITSARNAERERIAKRERDKMKAKEKVLKEQSIKRSSRTTKGQRYNQSTYNNKKSHVQMSERDREDAEAAAQFAAHVSLYHERVRKYMEREIERQKQCGRTDITDALVRIERQFGWDDGDSEDDNGPTYEWENERESDVYDIITEYKCGMCGGPLASLGGACWNIACVRCVLNPGNKKYVAAMAEAAKNGASAPPPPPKAGRKKKKRGRKASPPPPASKEPAGAKLTPSEIEQSLDSANKVSDFQLLAPVYFLGVPKPHPTFPKKKKPSDAYTNRNNVDEEDSYVKMDEKDAKPKEINTGPFTIPDLRKMEEEVKEGEEGSKETTDDALSRRSSRSTTAAIQKEIEKANKPKEKLSLRQKIDYMANVEKLYAPLDTRHDLFNKYEDAAGVPRLYCKESDWQVTRDADFMTANDYIRRQNMLESERQIMYASNFGNIAPLPSGKKYEKYIGTLVSGTIVQTNIEKHTLGPPLHPLDILRSRVAQEKQTERGNQYEELSRRHAALQLLEKGRIEMQAKAMANDEPIPGMETNTSGEQGAIAAAAVVGNQQVNPNAMEVVVDNKS